MVLGIIFGTALVSAEVYNRVGNDISIGTFESSNSKELLTPPEVNSDEVMRLTNAERSKVGLPPLIKDNNLCVAAQAKAQHMLDNNYFSHIAPDGTRPEYFIQAVGYGLDFNENILSNSRDGAEGVVHGWMTSTEGHREAMLSRHTLSCVYTLNDISYQGNTHTNLSVAYYAY